MKNSNYEEWTMFQNFLYSSGYPSVYSNFITLNYPYQINDTIFQSTHVSKLMTLNSPAGIFDNTIVIKPTVYFYYDSTQTNYIKELYLSPGVGTTKVVMTNSMTWNLVSFYSPKYCDE